MNVNEKYRKCLVIDSSYMARSVITTERAFVISYKGNATIVESHPESFGLVNPNLDIKKPSVIRVNTYVNVHQKVALNRENIYRRDNYECVYCGHNNKKNLTLDHVVPQAHGGPNTWDNLVTSCRVCNQEKADLTLDEYIFNTGKNVPNPKRPHFLMLMKKMNYIPEEWKFYLFMDEKK